MIKIHFWPTFLVLLLGANVAIVAVTMTLANRDGGPAITPEYDSRALQWDEFQRTQNQSDALGWTVTPKLRTTETLPGELSLKLTDRDDSPVANTMLVVTLFHNAVPKQPATFTLSTDDQGVAITPIDFQQRGLFTLHIESAATRTRPRFMHTLELAANAPLSSLDHTATLVLP